MYRSLSSVKAHKKAKIAYHNSAGNAKKIQGNAKNLQSPISGEHPAGAGPPEDQNKNMW
ncbi:hypothetical protein [uncultured Dysosmobacter sp.]|uniref:hypothetical protein n=1 Tax=uncultured Dysosmobacter sp. TaxID=2591384 RepID=UPI00262596D3|nr:hypothetical protein [uncultured Dysosmobacter sp.]